MVRVNSIPFRFSCDNFKGVNDLALGFPNAVVILSHLKWVVTFNINIGRV